MKKHSKGALAGATAFWGPHIIDLMEKGREPGTELGLAIDAIGAKLMPQVFIAAAELEDDG